MIKKKKSYNNKNEKNGNGTKTVNSEMFNFHSDASGIKTQSNFAVVFVDFDFVHSLIRIGILILLFGCLR